MRKKGRLVTYELLSNCVVGTTLASWFDHALQPKEGSILILLIVGACVISGAAHGCIAYVLGKSLFGDKYGRLEAPQWSVLEFTFEILESAVRWGMMSAFLVAAIHYPLAEITALLGQELWLRLIVALPAGLLAGMLSIRVVRWGYRDNMQAWIAMNALFLRRSNLYQLWRAKANAHSNRKNAFDPADLRR